jgi:excinuclease ABC subunit B
MIYRIEIESAGGRSKIASIKRIDAVSRTIVSEPETFFLFPAKHFITSDDKQKRAFESIKSELEDQLKLFKKEGKILEADRLKRRTSYDLALIREIGYCNGIENYSRHFSGKYAGEAPDTLLSYFPHKRDGSPDFLTIIDESHVTVPQIGGMFAGDRSRKETLVEHGFRLPSTKDNRPLTFKEFEKRVGQVIFTSATPGVFENGHSEQVVEQVIRPTGLIDPEVLVRPVQSKTKPASTRGGSSTRGGYGGQIADFIIETEKAVKKGGRVIATTLTKKMAEDLAEYLKEKKIKARYLHSEIKTIERIEILTEFRRGTFDCLVGVNLLREGLDLPEVTFIGILDADKEGFLRSETSLIQIIGRAARNVEGKVILYADSVTGSMKRAMDETARRRTIQTAYNKKHHITPKTIIKKIKDITDTLDREHHNAVDTLLETDSILFEKNPKKLIKAKKEEMESAVRDLDFESAAIIRDEIRVLEGKLEKKKAA